MYDKVANDFSIDYLVPFFHACPAWTLCIIGCHAELSLYRAPVSPSSGAFILLPWVAKLLLFIICLQMVVEVSRRVQPFILLSVLVSMVNINIYIFEVTDINRKNCMKKLLFFAL